MAAAAVATDDNGVLAEMLAISDELLVDNVVTIFAGLIDEVDNGDEIGEELADAAVLLLVLLGVVLVVIIGGVADDCWLLVDDALSPFAIRHSSDFDGIVGFDGGCIMNDDGDDDTFW